MRRASRVRAGLLMMLLGLPALAGAQSWPDPAPRQPGQGEGPHARLVIQGGTVVRGPAGAATAPADVLVEGNRIVAVGQVVPQAGDRVIDARGLHVVPGLINTHVRVLDAGFETLPPEYGLTLLLAHGITTIASMQSFEQLDWALRMREASAAHAIVAPRIQVWTDLHGDTPEALRANIRSAHARGVFGIGEGSIYNGDIDLMRAALDEARRLGMRSHWHMGTSYSTGFDALDAARAGMNGVTHWYGLVETLMDAPPVQAPGKFGPGDRRDSFANRGRLWKQAAAPGSARWNAVLDEFLALDFTLEPTFSVYEAHRDYMGVSGAEWHDAYLHPVLEKTFVPGTTGRFSHFYNWSSTDEVTWRENYRLWMAFVDAYRQRGGRVVAGDDPGFMWVNFGFGFIRNLEMLQEAGFSAGEALDAATIRSAEHLGLQQQLGAIEVGRLADLVLVDGDPLEDLKAFYATGTLRLQADGTTKKEGGVRYTVKDGVVYDARALMAQVADMVRQARAAAHDPVVSP